MTTRLDRLFGRSAAAEPPARPPGLHGDMDSPVDGTSHDRAGVLVGGWVVSEDGPVEHVEIIVDGVRAATVPVVYERADIGAHFAQFEHALVSGWTARVDLSAWQSDEVVVSAVCVRSDGRRDELARAACTLEYVPPIERQGRWFAPELLLGGYQRLYGVARIPGGIARVEVLVDGAPSGRARIALPGTAAAHYVDPDDALGAFEFILEVDPERVGSTVTLGGTVHGLDGSTCPLDEVSVRVGDRTVAKWPDGDRIARLQARADLRARHLAGVHALAGSEPVRALVFTHDLGLGGGQLYLQELLLRLSERGVWCAVVSPRGGVLTDELEALGYPVHVTGDMPVNDVDAYEGRIAELVSWAAPLRCNVALANTMLTFPGVDAAGRLGLPVAWAIHESFPLGQFWLEAYAEGQVHEYVAERAVHALRDARHAVFEAGATLEQYQPLLADDAGMVLPYGVSMHEIDEYLAGTERSSARHTRGLDDEELVVLCMGTVEPRKAQLMLAQAFAGARIDRPARLVIVGARPSSYLDALTEYLEEAGVTDRILVEPVTSDTYGWYRSADLLVCASDVESLPRSILECMAFGVPVLSTAVFGVPELITDDETGFLCEARDGAALRRRLEEVLALPSSRLRAVGEAGSSLVRAKHDPEIYADAYHRMLTEMAGAGAS